MIKKKFLFAAIIICSLNNLVFAQGKVGTTSFQFLEVMTSARATAMGEAFSSAADNSEAVFWNPAALTNVKSFDASVGFTQWFFDIKHFSFSAAYSIDGWGTFGLQGLYTDVGEIEVTTVSALGFIGDTYNPGLTGEVIRPHASVIGLSFAKNLTDKFAFGLTVKYVSEDLVVKSKGVVAFDGGLTFNTGYKSIKLGASVRHFGPEVKYIDKSYPLPQTFNIGISGYLFSPNDALLGNIGNQSILISYDLIQPRDYNQQYGLGMEYAFNNMFFLRGGYKFNGDQEGFSGGIGIHYNNYRLDYSYTDYGAYLSAVHRITLGFVIK